MLFRREHKCLTTLASGKILYFRSVSVTCRLGDEVSTMPDFNSRSLDTQSETSMGELFANSPLANYGFLESLQSHDSKKEFIGHVDRILSVARKYLTVRYLGRNSDFAEFANEVNSIKSKPVAQL